MAKKNQIAKSLRKPKFMSRKVNRCWKCGRNRYFMRAFGTCRICFRELASRGEVPGIKKASW
ncbi:type Z 30S ribosomal protein S14 [Candidatus Uhrbacteria bacterium CG_4_9_14_3_um_filter_41_35]|uniref:Small ribosomal subunit protein uS14 n=1 Tax=Candidatus Uhrbacteria bacterium CG_4_9_14_3_um_filter_41_35 TaxID=1975034 RepID=A0A2M7XG11_9BACT|nr:MAG: type Z 30S ribosomal protein S14 [Candidatus Uhrbacteria bacterium CG11_big_fil_rev_8_21_14_0_20_41_9]PJA46830.1 MAG: type Z 30S ribosomal protein S14 [Candidatus Uhrbacteria bacterium CG_4_9_14_3_um_filter_41_35]